MDEKLNITCHVAPCIDIYALNLEQLMQWVENESEIELDTVTSFSQKDLKKNLHLN